ncbi:hypothetical protein AAJCM20276_00530 [Acetobacter aceti]|uniref:DUF2474 domain-containing protein n=1 Tax=Acetobacter aceti TaxID=435 RepID=A0A6S6PDT5_ACEAC|nr:DUF2474 family protein [Acetobacter aceti]BCI65429.1 hypothetical protein AAJCM20276_00530 [Acetobacter aceti]
MRITDAIVSGRGEKASRNPLRRFGWFVAIWAMSTIGFIAAASVLKFFVPHYGVSSVKQDDD